MDVGNDNYQAVTLKEVLRGVIDPARQEPRSTPCAAAVAATLADGSAKLTQAACWQAIQGYLRPRMSCSSTMARRSITSASATHPRSYFLG
jgi:indolepyruvate decarboxylase